MAYLVNLVVGMSNYDQIFACDVVQGLSENDRLNLERKLVSLLNYDWLFVKERAEFFLLESFVTLEILHKKLLGVVIHLLTEHFSNADFLMSKTAG